MKKVLSVLLTIVSILILIVVFYEPSTIAGKYVMADVISLSTPYGQTDELDKEAGLDMEEELLLRKEGTFTATWKNENTANGDWRLSDSGNLFLGTDDEIDFQTFEYDSGEESLTFESHNGTKYIYESD